MKLLLSALLILPLAACGSEKSAGETPAPSVVAIAVEAAVRPVKCGCAIESVGRCGNYVALGEEWIAVANSAEVGLGAMEWCGLDGVEADVAGTREGNSLRVSSIEALE